jgi:hypothetical protein
MGFSFVETYVYADGKSKLAAQRTYVADGAETSLWYENTSDLIKVAQHLKQLLETLRYEWWEKTDDTDYFDKHVLRHNDDSEQEPPF